MDHILDCFDDYTFRSVTGRKESGRYRDAFISQALNMDTVIILPLDAMQALCVNVPTVRVISILAAFALVPPARAFSP